ncbi:hypothetical protein [Sphingosinicella sp. CPCC 101087]|uniref:hypothetical protein n=1 Tax=Sphingosinicella sp. CPCC 101087 TaxID=2497754 RepID=UPI00101C508D|nr:hypothetical protein [Sphingosinicella sp. CPCC 101087]
MADPLASLVFPLTALLLAVRGTMSKDVPWKRFAGAVLAVLPLLLPLLAQFLPVGGARPLAPAAAGAYLFAWAFMSRDPLWIRMASAVLGAAAFVPVLLLAATGFDLIGAIR